MRLRLLFEWCAIATVTLVVVLMLFTSRATDRLDNVVYDVLVGFRAPSASDRILLVTIDDQSLAAVGHWPWPRSVHARMLEQVAAARPAAVAYDVIFTEPSRPEEDERLGAAIRAVGTVALPVLFEAPGRDGRAVDTVLPIEPLAGAARAIGHAALLPDSEGVARSVPLSFNAGGRIWLHLMEAAYRIAHGRPSPVYRRLAAEGKAFATIPFQPSGGSFRTISFASVLAGEVPPDFIRDRILLVGVTAAGLGDRFRVPTQTGALISGIEVQANLLNSLLADRVITPLDPAIRLAAALVPTLALLLSFWWLRPSHALAASLAMIGLILIVPPLLLFCLDTWLPPTPALAGLLVAYPLWGWRRLQAVDRAISEELDAFSAEKTPVPFVSAAPAYLDPIGGQAARLRAAIANMRDLRQLISDTIDGVDDPLLVTNPDDRVILANAAAGCLFGKTLQDLYSPPLLNELAGEEVVFAREAAEIRLRNGKVYLPRRFPLRNHAGEQRGWILHLADITDISIAQREREEALEFLSHDMRSPLSSIITLLEQHRQSIPDRPLAGRLASLARRTLGLSDDFVQMARLSVAPFNPEDINLADVLTEAADELWPLSSHRNVRVSIDSADETFYLSGERDTLSRALINLLDNAVKFSPEGGTVQCLIRARGGTIECVIEDEGPGIEAERRKNLFARYGHRQNAAGSGISAGLGLAYVGAAVKRHGGTISCESRAPHGTRFVLHFAAAE
jgi:CHASE2 domain-containing sensor protein/signal transduction histidine kinase